MVLLTEEQKNFYKTNGYIVIKNALPKEQVDLLSEEYDKLFASKDHSTMENSWVGRNEDNRRHDGELTVKGIHNLQYHNAVFNLFIFNENILDALEGVMDTKNIMYHHTKAHMKPPEKGAPYPMHQDYHYFPYEKDSMVAVFLHLDAAGPENGGLFVYPGSHKLGVLEDVGARESNFHYVDQTKFSWSGATPVIAERGDVVIFSYLLVHGSPANLSNRRRRMLLLQVSSADDQPIGEQPLEPGQKWLLRGVNEQKDASISKQYES